MLFQGCAGLAASEARHHGHVQFLPGGGARQEPQEEQAHPPQPKGHPLQGGLSSNLPSLSR